MSGQRVLVMGGSSGIGEATAKRFAEAGAEVIVVGRNPQRLKEAVGRLGRVRGEVADGVDPSSVRSLFERVGPFDHLVLALSGAGGAGPLASLRLEDLRAGMEGKLFAHLTTLKAALPTLRESVTFVSAASARAALAGTAGLAAINGAIEAMVRPLANELAPLRVNAVSPGVIDTPWWDAAPKEFKEAVFVGQAKTLPVRRVGKPEEVAAAIHLVATNGFITGTVVEVTGGVTLAR